MLVIVGLVRRKKGGVGVGEEGGVVWSGVWGWAGCSETEQ